MLRSHHSFNPLASFATQVNTAIEVFLHALVLLSAADLQDKAQPSQHS